MRRVFDVICAAAGLLLLSPVFLFAALAIKFGDGETVFYSQPRVGKDFQEFNLLKFRSMVPYADSNGLLTAPNDSRITRVGRFLRKYKLDELPQLINILKGDMQLVGPRPEVKQYVDMFRQQYLLLLQERPGITDPATLTYCREERVLQAECLEKQYISQILPDKLALSLTYLQNRSFFSDLRVLFQTVGSVSVWCDSSSTRGVEEPRSQPPAM